MLLIAWRSVSRHKQRSVFLALCVVIGVAFVAGTFVLTDTIQKTYNGVFDDAFKGTSVSVRSKSELGSMTTRSPIPVAVLDKVKGVPGVRAVQGSVFGIGGRIIDANGKAVGNQFAPTFIASWPKDASMSAFRIASGHQPTKADEVVIDQESAKLGKFAVGSKVRIQSPTGVKRFTLVGIAKYGKSGNIGGASAALFDLATAQQLAKRVGLFDDIAISAVDGVEQTTLAKSVQSVIGSKYEAITADVIVGENQDALSKGLSFLNTFLLVFAGVSLFVGAFIIYNTFAIVISERTRELALLRALGAGGGQVIWSIIVESVIVGAVASAAGLAAGIGLAGLLKKLLSGFGISLPPGSLVLLPRTILVSLVGGLLVTVAAAVGPAIRASRVPPLAALRPVVRSTKRQSQVRVAGGLITTVAGTVLTARGARAINLTSLGVGAVLTVFGIAFLGPFLVRPAVAVLGMPLRKLRGVSGQLAKDNAVRLPQRTATTAAALMIGTALIAATLVLRSSIATSTDKILKDSMRAEFIVRAGGLVGIGDDVAPRLRKIAGVSAVTPIRVVPFKVSNSTLQLSAIDGAALTPGDVSQTLDLGASSGSFADLNSGGIAVSERVAKDHQWSVGSPVKVTLASGSTTQNVVAIYSSTSWGDYFVSLNTLSKSAPDTADSYALLNTVKGAPLLTVRKALTSTLNQIQPAASVSDRAQVGATIRAQVGQILNLISALVLLAIVIALLGVLITMLLSVFERTHELGLLRAIGMDRRDMRSMVRWEAALVATFGAALGVGLGVALGYALTRTLREQGISTIQIPFRSLIIMSLLVTFAGVIASLYPARRAGKLNVLKAIATE
jgi:putative ABC transport system permease protein